MTGVSPESHAITELGNSSGSVALLGGLMQAEVGEQSRPPSSSDSIRVPTVTALASPECAPSAAFVSWFRKMYGSPNWLLPATAVPSSIS